MSNKRKIINDPVLGFINIPSDFIFDLIEHPYIQRLTRIKQLGLSSVVYPGAQHSRFLHSLGAMHLMNEAITQLRSKGFDISKDEAEGALAAILLHDIGHGPFSHTLEHALISNFEHEKTSLMLIENINRETGGKLDTAIAIFTDRHPKKFLHQLVSSQLDMDRLDYLIRDCFFSGVSEGTIGAERIIKMLTVSNNCLAVEAKGIYSVENFLIARRLMYWQVYLHKTALAAERMLINIITRAKELSLLGEQLFASPALLFFLRNNLSGADIAANREQALEHFIALDDSDIISAVKVWASHTDTVLATLSKAFINRRLFKIEIDEHNFERKKIEGLQKKYRQHFNISAAEAHYFFYEGIIHNDTYNPSAENIHILYNNGTVRNISEASDMLNTQMFSARSTKYFLCYHKLC
ncbi:MAG: HD domain-containing protein [Prevotellaceae bacterium]|jgi:HD superfamily phosphohydrolase|nr:HD domain-containing protein [Prevotellaceae bacterium]